MEVNVKELGVARLVVGQQVTHIAAGTSVLWPSKYDSLAKIGARAYAFLCLGAVQSHFVLWFSARKWEMRSTSAATSSLVLAFSSYSEERYFSEENPFLFRSLCLHMFGSQLFFPSLGFHFGKENVSRQSFP